MRYLILLSAILIGVPAHAWMSPAVGGGRATAGAGGSYTDIVFWLNAEGTWSSPTYTAGGSEYSGSTGTAGGDFTISGTAPLLGSNSFSVVDQGDYMNFTASGLSLGTEGRFGFQVEFANTVASNSNLLEIDDGTTTNRIIVFIRAGADDVYLRWYSSSTEEAACGTAINDTDGTFDHFVEVEWDTSDGGEILKVYIDGVERCSSTSSKTANTYTRMQVGNITSNVAAIKMDQIMVSNDHTRAFYSEGLYNDTSSPR